MAQLARSLIVRRCRLNGCTVEAVPLVSFVMPVHNSDVSLLADSVTSVLDCTTPLELIVVDDGSTNTELVQFLERLAESDARVRHVCQPNGGVAAARNFGVRAASGEWICFVDPDDKLLDGSTAFAVLPEVVEDLVVAGAIGVPVLGGASETFSLASYPPVVRGLDLLSDMLALYVHGRASPSFVLGVSWAKFVRRSVFERHGLYFNESLVKRSDAEWMVRLLVEMETVRVVDESLVEYRIDVPGNLSRGYRAQLLDGYLTLGRTVASVNGLPASTLQLYYLELVKDAINAVFSDPKAPRSARSRRNYREFRGRFVIDQPLIRNGSLGRASLSRKLLYLAIKYRSYGAVRLLREARRVESLLGSLRRGCVA